jgi:Tfp pilus assembly protein PilP
MDSLLTEDLIRALRDPFQLPTSAIVKKETPKSELETLALKDFKLQGVISGPRKIRAMLAGAGGKTYFVKVGDRIGVRGGKITQITSDSVRVTEFYQDEKGRSVPDIYELRLAGELVSLTKKDEDKQ